MVAEDSRNGQDAGELAERLMELAERGQRITGAIIQRQGEASGFQLPDPQVIQAAFRRFAEALLADPARLAREQLGYWQQMGDLWQRQMRRLTGEVVQPMARPQTNDRRFKDEAWDQDPTFDFIKQSYLLSANWLQRLVGGTRGLDGKTRAKVEFYTRQLVDAMSPTNFALTNPQVLRHAVETNGQSLLKGFEHLLDDLERGQGELRITTTKETEFEVGRNLAVTPGSVVFENELMQLIQYQPSTPTVHRRPLLIVPPWINKFYILDLKPQNSFIKYCIDQGFTLFVISWVNPDAALAEKSFEDYMAQGPMAAMDAIGKAVGEDELCILGYCLGGTLTACLLSWLAAKGDTRIKAATFLTTMTDFEEPGDLAVFIDEEQLDLLESHMREKGFLEAKHMQRVFNLMRANDLIWSFVVSNYLMGREPTAFDLLYWNSDSTRMPFMMHRYYLRQMYHKNLLVQPGAIRLLDEAIDLGRIRTPCYFLSTREDHIAPWAATYRGSLRFGGPVRFVLGGSGHIAGVTNPVTSNKYGYRTNSKRPSEPDAWMRSATEHDGSWWPDWRNWLARRAGGKVAARHPGGGSLAVIEPAPGRYVKVRASD